MTPDMFWVFAVGALWFGAILGSFLNALLFRFNTGRGMRGRSRCMSCNHTLQYLDLVPIFSWVFLRGRCRYCGAKISFQYPLVEATAAVLSVKLLFLFYADPSYAVLQYLFWLLVWMTLLFVVVYDLKHQIIPWSCSILLAVLAFVGLFFSFDSFSLMVPTVWALLAGPLLALPLFLLSLVSGGRWMGFGDGALELSLGWFLGLSLGASAFMYAFWSGALVGVSLLLFARLPWSKANSRFTMKSEIPFAPYLVLGAALAYFLHVDLFSSLPTLF